LTAIAPQPARSTEGPAPSFWLDQIGAGPRRAALEGGVSADVCIVGGGFTGLWTAYELRRADPALEVVVLEAEHVGFGASGRNGGWVLGKVSGSAQAWRRRGGAEAPRRMARAINATVGEIGEVIAREGIECDWHQGGSLTVAQTARQLDRLRADLAAEQAAEGEDCAWQLLDQAQLQARVAVRSGVGALYTPYCARVQPAKLVTGLAAAAERAGARIYERSPVHELRAGRVLTRAGQVRSRYVLLATEGYTANLPGRRRALLPLNSTMIVTEPLSDETWAQIGWSGAETLLDGAYVYTYSQRTADGRIAIGGRGVPYRFGSRTDREGPVPERTVEELRERLGALFAPLGGVAVARGWHGVLGVARDWCPTVGFDPSGGFGFAGGYAGEGVAASNLAARTLRDLVLGRDSELARLPWVGRGARRWEPEPLRFLGARGIYGLYRLADRREAASGRGERVAGAANLIAGR
jgi:glycine/D-amino acid oxidase-like deaminating enzyme